jgi:hypothetical protein
LPFLFGCTDEAILVFRVLKEDADGDLVYGSGNDFLVDSPEAVGQAIKNRLLLWQGEWFLDLAAGTPWAQQILGFQAQSTRDIALRQVILGTPFVTSLLNFSSNLDARRGLSVSCQVDTAFGVSGQIFVPFALQPPSLVQIGGPPTGTG